MTAMISGTPYGTNPQAYFGVAGIEGTVPTPYKMRGWFVRVLGELAATYPQELHSELVERGLVEERQGDFRDHERVEKVRTRNFELRKTAFPWLLKKRPVNIAILGFLVVDRICHFSESKAQRKIPKVIETAKNIEEVFDPEYVFISLTMILATVRGLAFNKLSRRL